MDTQSSHSKKANVPLDLVEVNGKFVPAARGWGFGELVAGHLALAFFPLALTRNKPVVTAKQIEALWPAQFALFALASVWYYGLVAPAEPSLGQMMSHFLGLAFFALVCRFFFGITISSIYMGVSVGTDVTRSLIELVAHSAGVVAAGQEWTSRGVFSAWEMAATVLAVVAVVHKRGGIAAFKASR